MTRFVRLTLLVLCAAVLLVGPAATAQADTTTQLPFPSDGQAWLAVDPSGGHVFVSGGTGTSSIVVLNYAGKVVRTITGEGGASQMALDTATHTLYVALHDQESISEINTQTLTETTRFSTAPYPDPNNVAIAGGKLWFACFRNSGQGCSYIIEADLDGGNMAVAPAPFASDPFATDLASGGPGDKYLAVGDTYTEPPGISVYDVSGATPTAVSLTLDQTLGFLKDMTFDPSGAHLLLASAGTYVDSLTTGTPGASFHYPTGTNPSSVAVTADGKYVATGIVTGHGPDVFVYPVGKSKLVRAWQVALHNVNEISHSLAFSPDAKELFDVVPDTSTFHLAFHVLTRPTVALTATTTTLTRLTPSTGTVSFGSHISLKVHVHGAARGTVDLYATLGKSTNLVTKRALRSGSATFRVKPTQGTTYSASLEQSSTHNSSMSRGVRISVRPIVTISLHQLPKPVVMSGRRVIRTNLQATTHPHRPSIVCSCGNTIETMLFFVQRREGTSWHAVGVIPSAEIGGHGIASGWFATAIPGLYRVEAVYQGDADFLRSESAWKTVTVRPVR